MSARRIGAGLGVMCVLGCILWLVLREETHDGATPERPVPTAPPLAAPRGEDRAAVRRGATGSAHRHAQRMEAGSSEAGNTGEAATLFATLADERLAELSRRRASAAERGDLEAVASLDERIERIEQRRDEAEEALAEIDLSAP